MAEDNHLSQVPLHRLLGVFAEQLNIFSQASDPESSDFSQSGFRFCTLSIYFLYICVKSQEAEESRLTVGKEIRVRFEEVLELQLLVSAFVQPREMKADAVGTKISITFGQRDST